MRATAILLILLLCPVLAQEETTPAERAANLRRKWADEHADLGSWAKGKKLGRAARAHFRVAISLDPDCRPARLKLGHRRGEDGAWRPGREKDWADGRGAVERHGSELRRRERDLLREEAAAFEEVGLALLAEGDEELARRLLLRAHLLGPRREGAARGLGLRAFREGFVTPDVLEAMQGVPAPQKSPASAFLGSFLGVKTKVRSCGAVVGETMRDDRAAGELARIGNCAHLLAVKRFSLVPRGMGWITFSVADTQEQYERFLTEGRLFDEPYLSAVKKIGAARAFYPRHFGLTWCGLGGDPRLTLPNLVHLAAEDVLLEEAGERAPSWLHEAVGIDACLTLLGRPGPPCVVLEESAGLMMKDAFEEAEGWPAHLLRVAASGDLPRFELLVRSQLQALGPEDLMVSHLLYRYLVLTRRERLPKLLDLARQGREAEVMFREGIGASPTELQDEITDVLCGKAPR
jgi:hypothetical protein